MTNKLMTVRYVDLKGKISLTNYADIVVFDEKGGKKTLNAIRFGGYPESVDAMANAIYGGGDITVEIDSKVLMFKTLEKKYLKKLSHDAVYAEATLIATDDQQKATETKNEGSNDEEELGETELEDLPPRKSFIYVNPGDSEALFDAVDAKVSVPLIPEFKDYVLSELTRRNILVPMTVRSVSKKFEAWSLKCDNGDGNIISVVEDGLREGSIAIPGVNDSTSSVDAESVTEYLTQYGAAIAERIKSLFIPLFEPETDQLSQEVMEINENIRAHAGYYLYDAQLAVAEAIKRQLERHKVGLIIAECGAGKTKLGLTAIAPVVSGLTVNQKQKTKTFNIVLCPSHIKKKWVREIEETLPDTFAGIAESITDFDRIYKKYDAGDKSCYVIISKETARDGYMRAPAAVWSERKNTFICPDCGDIIEMPIMNDDGIKYYVKSDQFFFLREKRDNHSCASCGTSLWTALNPSPAKEHKWIKVGGYGFVYKKFAYQHLSKVKNAASEEKIRKIAQGTFKMRGAMRKFPLSTYIKNKYKGRIDGLIIDELHQYNNDSGQGDAMNDLYVAAKKVIGMTATLINGYSSGIFYLLYRIMPGLMQKDGKAYRSPNDFIGEYGVLKTKYIEEEADYNSNRRAVKRKKGTRQLPGVSPLVYSRFLLEYAAFLSLTDMGKDLPEYEEIPIALVLPEEVQNQYNIMQEALTDCLKRDKKAANKILSAYMNLLTAYPDQPYGQPPIIHPYDGYYIVEPPDMGDIDTVMPKDEKLLDIVKLKIAMGEKVLIYTNWTRLDTQKKLKKLLAEEGHKVAVLEAKVSTQKREAWVEYRLAEGIDVLITNPSLIETGLDLNAFTTIISYDIAHKLFTLRQASRRSWRINQTAPRVEVYFLYYADTMQHKAMKLNGTKLAVATIIEGGFSEEGLAAMSQCEDMTTLMAKELMLGIKDNVEDVSASFKRMAFLKSAQTQDYRSGFVEFIAKPVEITKTQPKDIETIEFTFKESAKKPETLRLPATQKAAVTKYEETDIFSQISLFEKIA